MENKLKIIVASNVAMWQVLAMKTTLTHRRSTSQLSKQDVILFAEDNGSNSHYGSHVWTLATELPTISQELIVWAAEYFSVDADEAEELVNPSNIVDTAGAWDDRQFVSDLWQAMEAGEIVTVAGYRTQDGAVVIDREAVDMVYSVEAD